MIARYHFRCSSIPLLYFMKIKVLETKCCSLLWNGGVDAEATGGIKLHSSSQACTVHAGSIVPLVVASVVADVEVLSIWCR